MEELCKRRERTRITDDRGQTKLTVRKEIRRKRQVLGYKDWWDKSCITMKRRVKRIYSRWRKGKIVRGKYIEKRKLYKKWLEKKQKEKRKEEELKRIKRETEVWKFINKKKGNKKNGMKIQYGRRNGDGIS